MNFASKEKKMRAKARHLGEDYNITKKDNLRDCFIAEELSATQSVELLDDFTANAGSNNDTCFARDYQVHTGHSFQAQPWCAMFVSEIIVHK